jgi:hypothetical protein
MWFAGANQMQIREGIAAAMWVSVASLALFVVTAPLVVLYLQ